MTKFPVNQRYMRDFGAESYCCRSLFLQYFFTTFISFMELGPEDEGV